MAETSKSTSSTAKSDDDKSKTTTTTAAKKTAAAPQRKEADKTSAEGQTLKDGKTSTSGHTTSAHGSTRSAVPGEEEKRDTRVDTAVQQPAEHLQKATVDDPAGVERIVLPEVSDGWEPAPVDPNPEDVKRAKARQEKFEEQRKERLDLLKKQSK